MGDGERGKLLGASPGLREDGEFSSDDLSVSVDQIDVIFVVHTGNNLAGDAVDLLDGVISTSDGVGLAGLDKELFSTEVE